MSDLHDRLERDLLHIANRATPSSNAWEAIQQRISEQADQPELEITMLKPNPDPNPNPWRTRVLAAAAAIALVVVGLLAIFSGDSNETETIDTPPTTVAPTTTLAPDTTQPDTGGDGDQGALPDTTTVIPMAVVGETAELIARSEPGEAGEQVRSIFPYSMDLQVVEDSEQEVDGATWVRVLSADGRDLDGWVPADSLIAIEGDLDQTEPLYEMASSVRNALLLANPANRLAERNHLSGLRVSLDGSFSDDDVVYQAIDLSQADVDGSTQETEVALFIEDFVATKALQETDRISINTRILTSAETDNSADFYPEATFVELHYSGDPGNEGTTWESVIMVFLPDLNTGTTTTQIVDDSTAFALAGLAFHTPAADIAVAEGFIAARNAYDGEAVRALFADGASNRDDLWRDVNGRFLGLDEIDVIFASDFDRVTGVQLTNTMCSADVPARVRCTYTWENDWTRALGDDRYTGNSFVFDIADGRISGLTHTFAQGPVDGFENHISEVQARWLQTNHPDDVSAMRDANGLPANSTESLTLWEAYTAEFVASQAG